MHLVGADYLVQAQERPGTQRISAVNMCNLDI